MSVQAIAWVLEHSNSRATERCVLISIANHVDHATGEGWAYVDQILEEANCHEDSYYRARRRLLEAGELEVDERGGGGRRVRDAHRPNLFRMPLFRATLDPRKLQRSRTPQVAEYSATSGPPQDADQGGPQVAEGYRGEPSIDPSSSCEAEAEDRQSAARDAHGFELVQLLAERIAHDGCRHLLWRPDDRGARILLGRRLAHLEDLGWQPNHLAVELAGGLMHPEVVLSPAAVLLTRARELQAVTSIRSGPDPAITREQALLAAHRYGENLALVEDLTFDELVAEAIHAYPDDLERADLAVDAARHVRAVLEATA